VRGRRYRAGISSRVNVSIQLKGVWRPVRESNPCRRRILQTEETTKTALVMPFIQILGYDIFDPTEVVPEFIADLGIKKGEI
jgi:hypothetical protein